MVRSSDVQTAEDHEDKQEQHAQRSARARSQQEPSQSHGTTITSHALRGATQAALPPGRNPQRLVGGMPGEPENVSPMTKMAVFLVALAVALGTAIPSIAAPKVARLGTDPAGDGPPALDITFLDVTTAKDQLEIRVGVDQMLPVFGGYPEGPGIEWIFTVGKRSFIAEAVAARTPKFFFFELKGHSYEQLQGITGTYDPADGFIRMLVPLELIGAKSGSRVSGYHKPLEMINKDNGTDVDAHLHTPDGGTEYLDDMKTSKSYLVP